ncbi:membrane protein [Alkalihalobacillus alcalophilus ATCC 27647 = CGMCC 1.3604]|uniref:Membrane protein n=1 Tax=Alkalihalobacillus alcalophilus ATCC 27647 = CGMCC 1.3604 TaxID=1218173 RepID=A0A094WL59_ALKAL|nr:hypothetical protein [Alkalihalobacillus alcalophilus]KGA96673.1 membrane protein [Alkalihalobacillus alcalophilus ATCC 27647 = CGMCC 1.3604]MED1562395.1 hypothetical protein [Alkalihalobacillus alcalophilus]THG89042.1 membrane protein [Alkalihalobacillus alcalophilus ATCC 27647 = CGMCC 1.3604]
MKEVIYFISDIVNWFHSVFSGLFGVHLNDKQLHFWVIGLFGVAFFFLTHFLFKVLSKWSITVLSFIYAFTVVLVVVFAIEIQQGITGSGNMEFDDAVAGIKGFLLLFAVFLLIKWTMMGLRFLFKKVASPKKKLPSNGRSRRRAS